MSIQETVRQILVDAIAENFDIQLADLAVEVPPRTDLGDLAFPVAFELAKRLKEATGQKHNPREVASRLAERLREIEGVSRVDVAGAGYINVFFDRADYLLRAAASPSELTPQLGGKIIVEHTSVNPNKAAHIGHLRNAVLGDTIARMLRATGENVEVQNYIDNTGVQVADVVVGFKHIEQKSLDEIKAIGEKFDYYCWDLYARVGTFYEEDKSRLSHRAEVLHELEKGEGAVYEMADYISTRILRCHLDTMARVGIEYDVLPRESDVLHLHLWEEAFALLKERGGIEHETEGKLAGCWVMRSLDETKEEESEHEADKVIVRSNGTVTYTGKDIAFHLWKLGQLNLDFYYNRFHTYADGHQAWITAPNDSEEDAMHPKFGKAAAYFNVIDIGQSYPQHYVKLGVMAVDHDERVERSAHLAYEKVVLSTAAAEQLGQRLSDEDRQRGAISMSGRKGLGVKADDLIDELERGALAEVASRQAELDEKEQQSIAHKIAVGALRYYLLKYSRNSIISFDFKEALAWTGETGAYIQNAVVRAASIFRRLDEEGMNSSPDQVTKFSREEISGLLTGKDGDEFWSLAYLATRLPDVVRGAVTSLEPALVAKWAFELAQSFNKFYERHRIKSETNEARRALLIAISFIARRQMVRALELLGIEAPDRM
jgi:arginyl-tRNA synthetase